MNPAEWLARTARETPRAPAIFLGSSQIADYGEFARRAAAIGASLLERGIGRGDRVALFLPNSVDYLPILYGVWYAGATPVPINGKLHAREAAWIIEHSGSRLAFARDTAKLGERGDPSRSVACVDPSDETFAGMQGRPPLSWPRAMDGSETAWLFYTSGTTGRPKGAMISAANLVAMSLSYLVDVDDVSREDAALYAAPMSHGAGLYNFVHVLRGARHVVPESGGFDPGEILDLARRLRNVSMFAAPTMVKRLIEHSRRTGGTGDGIRTIVYGGGPMYVVDIREALEAFGPKFVQIYGQGESPMTISTLSRADLADRTHPKWEQRLSSVGRPFSAAEVRVVDDAGTPLPSGVIGEVAVRGPQVMKGYLDNPEANARSLRDGWLRTGDLGDFDEDGYLYLRDRTTDVVISGGSNIYPREVEEAVLTHADVSEVAVVGVPDPEWGEVVVAFVVTRDGREIEPEVLDSTCAAMIARFKKPKRYVFVRDLPRNNYGKILKTELRAGLAAEQS